MLYNLATIYNNLLPGCCKIPSHLLLTFLLLPANNIVHNFLVYFEQLIMELFHIYTVFSADADVFLLGLVDLDGGFDVFGGGYFCVLLLLFEAGYLFLQVLVVHLLF